MFFALSKTLGDWITTPHYLALSLVGLALLLRLLKRGPKLRRFLCWFSIAYLWLMATGAFANLLLYPLETRHVRPARLERPATAIVMLTGTTDHMRTGPGVELTESADRFVEAVRLAHLYPRALLVFSGGSSDLVGEKRYREAEALAGLAAELGIAHAALGRVLQEGRARDCTLADRLLAHPHRDRRLRAQARLLDEERRRAPRVCRLAELQARRVPLSAL
jgi:hypothetical protein